MVALIKMLITKFKTVVAVIKAIKSILGLLKRAALI